PPIMKKIIIKRRKRVPLHNKSLHSYNHHHSQQKNPSRHHHHDHHHHRLSNNHQTAYNTPPTPSSTSSASGYNSSDDDTSLDGFPSNSNLLDRKRKLEGPNEPSKRHCYDKEQAIEDFVVSKSPYSAWNIDDNRRNNLNI